MLFQESYEGGEVIRPVAFRVAEQRGGQGGILGSAGLTPDRNERFLENPGAEDILRSRVGRKLKRGPRRIHFRGNRRSGCGDRRLTSSDLCKAKKPHRGDECNRPSRSARKRCARVANNEAGLHGFILVLASGFRPGLLPEPAMKKE